MTPAELDALGATLGSDVPLFFHLPCGLLEGRGERVTPCRLGWSGTALLVHVPVAVSTREVYGAWRDSDAGMPRPGDPERILQATTAPKIMALLLNDLEPAIFRVAPQVAEAFNRLERDVPGQFRVSGAGSTLYRLFDDHEDARRTADRIEAMRLGVTTHTVPAPAAMQVHLCEE